MLRWFDGNILDSDRLFVPLNPNKNHWTLLVVFMQMKLIRYYDSLCLDRAGDKYSITMLRYLNDMSRLHRKVGLRLQEWKFKRCTNKNTPQQSNSYDCGVFTALFANLLSDDISLQPFVKKLNTSMFRQHMYNAIVLGSLNL